MMGTGTTEPSARRFAGGLSLRQFLGIACLFWAYVALSNILYAYSMGIGTAGLTTAPIFAHWNQRLLQHLLLLPAVLVSFWASLRIQWRPLVIALPLQLILGTVFSAVAYPAMILAEMILGGEQWHKEVTAHAATSPFNDPMFLSLWVASFVSFLPTYGFGLGLV